jgi:hypothetical protein
MPAATYEDFGLVVVAAKAIASIPRKRISPRTAFAFNQLSNFRRSSGDIL